MVDIDFSKISEKQQKLTFFFNLHQKLTENPQKTFDFIFFVKIVLEQNTVENGSTPEFTWQLQRSTG